MAEMEKHCMALAAEDSIPRGELRELAVTSGIVSIFRATAGVVTWTGAELDDISKLWIREFKQAAVEIPEKHGQFCNHSCHGRQRSSVSIGAGSLDRGLPDSPGPMNLLTR
jgi:hypothetical protein